MITMYNLLYYFFKKLPKFLVYVIVLGVFSVFSLFNKLRD